MQLDLKVTRTFIIIIFSKLDLNSMNYNLNTTNVVHHIDYNKYLTTNIIRFGNK